ncbi:DNA repair protein RadA [Candidatus Gracilibacteria bacterium]|nr:DNA repair protein RadA [Candidatus Gracilibacteria bacterium]
MAKLKTIYVCEKCGEKFPKWSGQCLSCKNWNCLYEDVIDTKEEKKSEKLKEVKISKASANISKLGDEDFEEKMRIKSGIGEFDRVLGGGFVSDSITLLTGDPGVGKSTLVLQASGEIANSGKKVLYVSGEESLSQVSSRAKRIFGEKKVPDVDFISTSDIDEIFGIVGKILPDFVIIDSINTIQSDYANGSAGGISQIKACSELIMHFFKKIGIPVLLIGHVTKGGEMAGPQALAHLVDVVLHFEGERYNSLKMLRGIKNRFGATSEIGIFEMEGVGLKEVKNPSEIFLNGKANSEGSAISVTLEGTRPFISELQALVNFTNFPYPKRIASGIELNRLNIQIAILSKHCNLKLDNCDVFVSTVGGFKLNEPAADLAICAAIISSKNKKTIPEKTAFLGEVSLSGEVRNVSHLEKRIKELEKLGFENLVCGKIPEKVKKNIKSKMNFVELSVIKGIFRIF